MTLDSEIQRDESDHAMQRWLTRSGDGVISAHCAQELSTRLDMLAITPRHVAVLGWSAEMVDAVLKRWPKSNVVVVESNLTLAEQARQAARRVLRNARFTVDACELAQIAADQPFDFAIANLALARSATPDAALAALAKTLAPSAGLLLAYPGPDTLRELRAAWGNDPHTHVASFPDMHDLGSAFSRHGFTESVLNVERLTLSYRNLNQLWLDLTEQGARNSEPNRRNTLTGKTRFRRMCDKLQNEQGGTEITVELIYAQTWRANSASADRTLQDNEIRIGLDQLTRR
ncbi:MAG: class I SAM-dependent methyltransferase [Pseudomonadota bacterium]